MMPVSIDGRGIAIDGRPITLFCASLFYFRVPEQLWEERLRAIHAQGYNCIDVYFPWNFHETSPGAWDLESGMRNPARFLDLAAAEGLYVIARPGPYICSEWDGGALPAWLFSRGIAIRQNDPGFLREVREWFGRIMPIIAARQLGRSGTVIMLQIENELDFFSCADPQGYIAALRDMALEMGITMPLIACAGQGDFPGAWADTAGVVPAINFHLDPALEDVEAIVGSYADRLARLGFPLLIMETGRDVLLLRRLFSCGAKLVGAYNQVAGNDFGFTTAVNNWGNPLSFLSTVYDFNSLVDAVGTLRGNAWEDHALAGFLTALAPVFAQALPCRDHGLRVEAGTQPAREGVPALRLSTPGGDGLAVAVHNIDDAPLSAVITGAWAGREVRLPVRVSPRGSAFALFDVPLSPWGLPGRILSSSAEPLALRGGERPLAVFQSMGPAEVRFDFGQGVHVFSFDGAGTTRQSVELPGGAVLALIGMNRREVGEATLRDPTANARPAARRPRRRGPALKWTLSAVTDDELFPPPAPLGEPGSLHVEHRGGYRGYALYRTQLPAAGIGVLLHEAADVLSAYLDGRFLGTRTPGGAHAWFPLPSNSGVGGHALRVRSETWGHSNFDDPRLPAIRISSCRGFSSATVITRRELLFPWRLERIPASPSPEPTIGTPGGGLTDRVPARFRSSFVLDPGEPVDRAFLWAEGIGCPILVEGDGKPLGWMDPLHPILDLGGAASSGRPIRIVLEPQKWYASELVGRILFARGVALRQWELARAEEAQLLSSAMRCDERGSAVRTPLRLAPGSMAWLKAVVPPRGTDGGLTLHLRGVSLKASVFLNTMLVGRLFLPSPMRPPITGGRDDCAWLPGCWIARADSAVRILLEAVGEADGRLDSIALEALP